MGGVDVAFPFCSSDIKLWTLPSRIQSQILARAAFASHPETPPRRVPLVRASLEGKQ